MAFDKTTRNRLASFVGDARRLIADEFTQKFQSIYGISDKGEITPVDQLSHLDESGLATAALLRDRIEYLVNTHPDDKDGTKAAVERLAREQAFTILNRLAAIRMAEKRGLIVESVGKGYQSKGFKVFEQVAGSGLGDIYHRYRRYLFCLFDELSVDLGSLFDRRSPQALLFPREPALLALIELINAPDIDALWTEDETIGWIYQYYNDPAERKKMRDESAAPRNSRELAVRNQFFTPRYVVEFLTDNTLGRIWYEMNKGQTRLAEQCRYLVRRYTEIFLAEGEVAPEALDQEDLNQEQLHKRPVNIPHRPLKDPREIRLLDPACGSMHFGLYAFDLFEIIYEEVWDNGSCLTLQEAYHSKDEFLKDVPRLIIEHNIHGIDIDPRAVQIAGLSLWLRAQKTWQARGVKPVDRPRVRRSNIVCAEPMPGSPEMLEEFVKTLKPELLGELVKTVFDKMQLAGEAGSLLKIEEEIRSAIENARKEWLKQQDDLFTHKEDSQVEFFDTAEQQVIDALRAYAEQADADSYQRRLFADDAARGFAFIDLCRNAFDVAVMNPPFGDPSKKSRKHLDESYEYLSNDMSVCFVQRMHELLESHGRIGILSPRNPLFLETFAGYRRKFLLASLMMRELADLGFDVLDNAMIEVSATVLEKLPDASTSDVITFFRLLGFENKEEHLLIGSKNQDVNITYRVVADSFKRIEATPFCYWLTPTLRNKLAKMRLLKEVADTKWGLFTADDPRFLRGWWEVVPNDSWPAYFKGGAFARFIYLSDLVLDWRSKGRAIKENRDTKGRSRSRLPNPEYYFRQGLSFPNVTFKGLAIRALPRASIFSLKGPGIFPHDPEMIPSLMALLNTRVAELFVSAQSPTRRWDLAQISRIPIPDIPVEIAKALTELAISCSQIEFTSWQVPEVSRVYCPFFCKSQSTLEHGFHRQSKTLQAAEESCQFRLRRIEEIAADLYNLSWADKECVERFTGDVRSEVPLEDESNDGDELTSPSNASIEDYCSSQLSFWVGATIGRWDIRYATGERQLAELPDPFDPLPVCSPGMLQSAEGLPAEPKDVTAYYPLRISWSGILVDDENHPEDIVVRVREAIEIIWKDRAEAIEQEACEVLGVKSLRDYCRRPAAFFADHLKCYSKSRRQAPIYWPLSTKSGSYTLWLYYHRLTDQTLHTCLADFLDPKIRKVQSELDALTASSQGGSRAGDLRELLDELKDLHDEIERIIKLPWKPNLDDGVLFTAAPLWKLFRLPKWQKDLKACWNKLEKGEFDWAHLAYSIWPKRVEEACKKDRSMAIAHGLEHLCQVEPPKTKAKRGKKNISEEDEE